MTDVERREKVIRGLECCITGDPDGSRECKKCPYRRKGITNEPCFNALHADALALLREQEPRVLTLDEVINAKDKTDVWLEELDCVVVAATISNWVEQKNHAVTFFYGIEHTAFEEIDYMNNNYNRTWRCWTSRPTPDQMRDTPWEG